MIDFCRENFFCPVCGCADLVFNSSTTETPAISCNNGHWVPVEIFNGLIQKVNALADEERLAFHRRATESKAFYRARFVGCFNAHKKD